MPKKEITKLPVVLKLPRMDEVTVQQNVEFFRDSKGTLVMDVYYPPEFRRTGVRPGVVVLVTGHADPVIAAAVGCQLKDTAGYVSWGKLIAASGLVAVTYSNSEPARDSVAVLNHLEQNAEVLGVDANKIGLWSCSANVPNALSLLMSNRAGILCAAFLYGFMLDLNGRTFVADAARHSGFAAPNADKSVQDFPPDIPLLIVRAGADQIPGINQTIDDFSADALAHNLPVTLVNHPNAPHSFDILDSGELTKQIIRDTLAFFVFYLRDKK